MNKERWEQSRRYSHIGQVSHSNFAYAFQYSEAFELLYKSNAPVDTIVHPLMFTLRHYLELILKANIEYFGKFSGSDCLIQRLAETHEITKLANGFKEHWTLVKKRAGLKIDDSVYFNDFDKLIDIFTKLDDKSFSFRFASDKKGNKSFEWIDKIDIYEMKQLYEQAKILLNHSVDVFDDHTGIMDGLSEDEVVGIMESKRGKGKES